MQKIRITELFLERNEELVSLEGWGTLSNMGFSFSLLTSQTGNILTYTQQGLTDTVNGYAMLKKYYRNAMLFTIILTT